MNTANSNGTGIALTCTKCTVSYNTANRNQVNGIDAGGSGGAHHSVTRNVAIDNSTDYLIHCPSDVTFNNSTNGFPASYDFSGSGFNTVGND